MGTLIPAIALRTSVYAHSRGQTGESVPEQDRHIWCLTENPQLCVDDLEMQGRYALLLPADASSDADLSRFPAVFYRGSVPYVPYDAGSASGSSGSASASKASSQHITISLPPELHYLGEGDIVRWRPARGEIDVMYRRKSHYNTLFFTDRCNSRCVMCSQPPRDVDDSVLIDDLLEAIPLMDPATRELAITGGEPTLLYDRFIEVARAVRRHLPATALHILSNGRLFAYTRLAQALAEIGHADVMVGIPLYADIPSRHDMVVQARGAFDQTVRGIINLGRVRVPVEIRVVLHRLTADRLDNIARFVARNLPFVHQVVFMGMEQIGFAKSNWKELYLPPRDYTANLAAALETLTRAGIRGSIYNLPLCALPPVLRPFAQASISDWKKSFPAACAPCTQQAGCCGFFSWQTETPCSPIVGAEG